MSAEGEKRERIGIVSPNESLDSCVPAFTLRASGAVAAALAEGRLDLDAGSGLVGVLDGLVDRAACTRLIEAAAIYALRLASGLHCCGHGRGRLVHH